MPSFVYILPIVHVIWIGIWAPPNTCHHVPSLVVPSGRAAERQLVSQTQGAFLTLFSFRTADCSHGLKDSRERDFERNCVTM